MDNTVTVTFQMPPEQYAAFLSELEEGRGDLTLNPGGYLAGRRYFEVKVSDVVHRRTVETRPQNPRFGQ